MFEGSTTDGREGYTSGGQRARATCGLEGEEGWGVMGEVFVLGRLGEWWAAGERDS